MINIFTFNISGKIISVILFSSKNKFKDSVVDHERLSGRSILVSRSQTAISPPYIYGYARLLEIVKKLAMEGKFKLEQMSEDRLVKRVYMEERKEAMDSEKDNSHNELTK